ncbi:MAG: hypothetical protein JOZ02_18590 [Acidobacteria bacterium]|nr:hypothetical protein [Acidobacteriota bacterium]
MTKKIVIALIVVAVAVAAALALRQRPAPERAAVSTAEAPHRHTPAARPTAEAASVPAHYETGPAASSLLPTLPPEKFQGVTRDAYKAVGEIPRLIAQLPCYCHCDRGFGHKSLQSCFVDEHAAHCAVCVEEALTAYKLQKQGLGAAQIRERIIAQYAN